MIFVLIFYCVTVVASEPELIRDTYDYLNYGGNEDFLQRLPTDEVVLRPQEVKGWPQQAVHVGQVVGLAIDHLGQPVIFHRVNRIFDESSFNQSYTYQHLDQGPLSEDPVLILDPHTGAVREGWGAGTFYMPHGLTIDHHNNFWLTDIALHQVLKYSPDNHHSPAMVIGKAFDPGHGTEPLRLCMPTAVAVASTGEIFIADGYCNNRILKLNALGVLLQELPTPVDEWSLNLPHSIALLEHSDMICIADRENRRIVCPKAGLKTYRGMFDPPVIIEEPTFGKIFGIASQGNMIYAINGPDGDLPDGDFGYFLRGFTINPLYGKTVDTWEPTSDSFKATHSIAVTKNGSHVYVSEMGPNRIWKFKITDVYDK